MKKITLFLSIFAVLFVSCGDSGGYSPSMELAISFSGETATRAELTYGASSNASLVTTVSAAVSAGQARFTLLSDYADDYGWFKIYSLRVYNGDTLRTATTTENEWFQFVEDTTKTIRYTLTATTTGTIIIPNTTVDLGTQFIRGFDASEVDYYENDVHITWADTDGTQKDFFQILAAHGVNTVRLRIWNDPTQFSASVNTGMNDLERTIAMAKRVSAAGLSLMLDFHYSDTWADPGRQIVPAAWKDLGSAEEVAAALSAYTTQVLTALREKAGVVPAYVQIGNEINAGLLLHVSTSATNNNVHTDFAYRGNTWEEGNNNFTPTQFITYLKAGADAVRAFDDSIKIVLHVASGGYENWGWIFDPVKQAGVPFDVIGYSYYPWEKDHGDIATLKKAIKFQKERYNVDVFVAECSAHWADESDKTAQKYTYQHMKNPATGSLYADLATGSSGSALYVTGSVQNQANVLRHIMEETADAGGIGIFTWGGDLYGNAKWGMFDSSGKALQSLDIFAIK